jgi:Flp pilus assembly protein TadG
VKRSDGIARTNREQSGGFYTVVFAIILPLFIGTLGLGIDMSHWWWAQSQLQTAADAAAFAGAKDLNSTGAGRVRAMTAAANYAAQYKVDGMVLSSGNVTENTTGKWDFGTKSFTTTYIPDLHANAIKVTLTRTNVPSYFSGFFPGATTAKTLKASAIAVAGGPRAVACGAPIAIAACVLNYDSAGKLICPTNLSFQGGATGVGLTLPDGSSPVNGNKAKPYFANVMDDPDGCDYDVAIGDTLHLQNGNDLANDSVKEINDATNDGANPVSIVLPVLDMGACSGSPTYNQSAKVAGFLKVKVVGARWTGNAPTKVAQACPTLG